VREPISWLGSWYRYRRRPFVKGQKNSTHEVSFDEFVLGYLNDKPPAFANVGSQAKFLEPRPNGTSVTHLFRYEDQSRLVQFLEARLQTQISTGRENVSPEIDLQLSPEIETRLRSERKEDFDLWKKIDPIA
jgi:hypothetical protein